MWWPTKHVHQLFMFLIFHLWIYTCISSLLMFSGVCETVCLLSMGGGNTCSWRMGQRKCSINGNVNLTLLISVFKMRNCFWIWDEVTKYLLLKGPNSKTNSAMEKNRAICSQTGPVLVKISRGFKKYFVRSRGMVFKIVFKMKLKRSVKVKEEYSVPFSGHE